MFILTYYPNFCRKVCICECKKGVRLLAKVQITDFTDEKLGFIGALIYKAAAEWFAENESAEQRENGFEQQKAS